MLQTESKDFYRKAAKISLPILAQGTLTYLIGFLDNIMVGQVGTEAMSGVAIGNQLHFVYYNCLMGIVAGGSVFGSQFYGKKDMEGFRESFRFRFLASLILSAFAFLLLLLFGENFISLFLHTQDSTVSSDITLQYGKRYLTILLLGMAPFAVTQVYASAMKDMGKTLIPMAASVAAILANTFLNYLLIFGKMGAPKLGVQGAAIATVISRFIELTIILLALCIQKSTFRILRNTFGKHPGSAALRKRILLKSLPLMINESFWSIGTSVMLQCYSFRGIHVVAGLNIATSIYNMFTVIYTSIGGTVAIMMGQLIGAGKMQEARASNKKLFWIAITASSMFSVMLFAAAPFIPQIYATTSAVQDLASQFMRILAVCLPISCFTHVAFFTIRAGGKALITFLYDSLNLWVINIPLAYCLTRYTSMPIVHIYFLCQTAEIVKLAAGYILVKKGVWLNNIVNEGLLELRNHVKEQEDA